MTENADLTLTENGIIVDGILLCQGMAEESITSQVAHSAIKTVYDGLNRKILSIMGHHSKWITLASFTDGKLQRCSLHLHDQIEPTWKNADLENKISETSIYQNLMLSAFGGIDISTEWGDISTAFDPRNGTASICVSFK